MMPYTITESRQKREMIVARLNLEIVKVINEFAGQPEGLTMTEVMLALSEHLHSWAKRRQVQEWDENDQQNNGETR